MNFKLTFFFILAYFIAFGQTKNTFQMNGGLVRIVDLDLDKSLHLSISYERALKNRLSIFTHLALTHGSGGGWGFADNGEKWGIKGYGIKNSYPAYDYHKDKYYMDRWNTSFKIAKVFYVNSDLGLSIRLLKHKKHQLNLKVAGSFAYAEESGISEDTFPIYDPTYLKEPVKFVIPYYSSYYVLGGHLSFSYRYFLKPNFYIGLSPCLNIYPRTAGAYYGILLSTGVSF